MDVGLRPLRLTDWEAVHDWARLEEACRYQVWGPNTPEQTLVFVENMVAAWARTPQQEYQYVIVVDGTVSGLARVHVLDHRQAEISYSVHPTLWGQGIATRAGRELLRIGFDQLARHRMFGICDPRNSASARILVKLGMTYEGRLRQNMLIRDGWRDSDVYSVLEPEWRASSGLGA